MRVRYPKLATNVLIWHTRPLIDRRQRNAVAFSCLYEHQPTERIHGVQYVAPSELPVQISLEDLLARPLAETRRHLGTISLTDAEKTFYAATVALTELVDACTASDVKYSRPPVDNEALVTCSDEELDQYDEWSDAHSFSLSITVDEQGVLQHFLRSANMLLANGAIYRNKSITRTRVSENILKTTPHSVIFIGSTEYSGKKRHLDFRLSDEPAIQISITEDGIEHVYERSSNGLVETRMHNGDEVERYKGLRSFEAIYEEDGSLGSFSWSSVEWDELQARERAIGLFESTAEKLDFFLERIKQLLP